MSRTFDRVNDSSLASSVAPIVAAPCTVACWFYNTGPNIGFNDDTLIQIQDNTATNSFFKLEILKATGQLNFVASSSGGAKNALSAVITGNVWQHGCGVAHSPTDRRAFLNGGSKGVSTVNVVPTNMNSFTVGREGDLSQADSWIGRIAEVIVWNVALSDAEVAILAAGISPWRIRPESIAGYWPLYGVDSPEQDLSGNSNPLSLVNNPGSAGHAPVAPPFGFDLGWQGIVATTETPVSKSIQTGISFAQTIQLSVETSCEASQGLANSTQSEIESNVLSTVSVSTSVESTETAVKSIQTKAEYAGHILGAIEVPIENLSPASNPISTSFESLAAQTVVSKSIQTQIYFTETVQATRETAYETAQLVASLRSTPHESLAAMKKNISTPTEHLRGTQSIKQSEIESNALSGASASTSLEHIQTSERSVQTQTEHLNPVAQSTQVPIENLISASNTISTSIEFLGAQTAVSKAIQTEVYFAGIVQFSKQTEYETSETLISSRASQQESLASLSKQAAVLTEHLQSVQGVRATGFEFSGTGTFVSKSISTQVAFSGLISVPASVEIESTKSLTASRASELESLSPSVHAVQSRVEYIQGIGAQESTAFESKGLIESSRSTQIEHWQRLEKRIQTEYETLKSVSRLTGVSVENLLSITKQVETDFESLGSGLVLQVGIEDTAQFAMAIEETAQFAMEIEDAAQF